MSRQCRVAENTRRKSAAIIAGVENVAETCSRIVSRRDRVVNPIKPPSPPQFSSLPSLVRFLFRTSRFSLLFFILSVFLFACSMPMIFLLHPLYTLPRSFCSLSVSPMQKFVSTWEAVITDGTRCTDLRRIGSVIQARERPANTSSFSFFQKLIEITRNHLPVDLLSALARYGPATNQINQRKRSCATRKNEMADCAYIYRYVHISIFMYVSILYVRIIILRFLVHLCTGDRKRTSETRCMRNIWDSLLAS